MSFLQAAHQAANVSVSLTHFPDAALDVLRAYQKPAAAIATRPSTIRGPTLTSAERLRPKYLIRPCPLSVRPLKCVCQAARLVSSSRTLSDGRRPVYILPLVYLGFPNAATVSRCYRSCGVNRAGPLRTAPICALAATVHVPIAWLHCDARRDSDSKLVW